MKVALIVFRSADRRARDRPAAPLAHREVLSNGIVRWWPSVRPSHRRGSRVSSRRRVSIHPGHAGPATSPAPYHARDRQALGPELDSAIEFVGGHLERAPVADGVSESLSVLKRDLGLGLDLLRRSC